MEYTSVPANGQVQAPPQVKTRRPHRPRKDYTNLDTVFDSLDDLKTALRHYMENATAADASPQYVSCAMTLSTQAALPLKTAADHAYAQRASSYAPFDGFGDDLDIEGHDVGQEQQEQEQEQEQEREHSRERDQEQQQQTQQQRQMQYKTVLELVNIDNLKERQTSQRSAAKGIIQHIQDLDGFKYCFNNNWSSKDDNGYRYSYTCLDSLENKDRHANGFRANNAATRRPGANTRGVRKPTYDCKGQIAVKFSALRQSVEVVYKHHAIHKTVAERRPPPRKDSKRKSITQQPVVEPTSNPGLLSFPDQDTHNDAFILHDDRDAPFQSYPEPVQAPVTKKPPRKPKDSNSNQPRPKRQKPLPHQPSEHSERSLSLVEILQQSMVPSAASRAAQPLPTSSHWPRLLTAQPNNVTTSYQPIASRPSSTPSHQQPQPPDVGRFSKLAVPCFKCKSSQTQVRLVIYCICFQTLTASHSVMAGSPFAIPASSGVPCATILRF
jgi:hypothetical protein